MGTGLQTTYGLSAILVSVDGSAYSANIIIWRVQ